MALSFKVLQNRNFRFLMMARMFGAFALQAQAVIVGWQIYSLTKDPFLLGLVGLAEAVPAITCALFAGHVVDNSQPKKIYKACQLVQLINTVILLMLAGGHVATDDSNLIPILFAGVFVSGLARSFYMPASFSLLSQIIAKADMPAASAWMSSSFQVAAIGGPAIAGLIYAGFGATVAWYLPAFCLAACFMMIVALKLPPLLRDREKRLPAVKSIKEGWAFILNNPALLSVMALDMFAVLFGGAVAMLPAFADKVLFVGPEGLGILRAAPAIGSVSMALFLATHPMKIISAQRLLFAVAGFGACMIGFGLSKIFILSVLFLAMSGAFDSISMVIRGTLMQLLTPEAMRGRVSSVNSMFIISSNEIGAFESGLAAKLMGLVPSIVFGGVGTLFVVGFTSLVSPKFRKMEIRANDDGQAASI